MRVVLSVVAFVLGCDAFNTPSFLAGHRERGVLSMSVADELGIPCEDDCALATYPNLPDSVHPGVVTGQALVDLLQHAKDNGKQHSRNLVGGRYHLC